jgi:hypothetical protein
MLSLAPLLLAAWFPSPNTAVDFTDAELATLQSELHSAYDSDFVPAPFQLTFFKSIPSYLSLATVQADGTHRVAIMAGNLHKPSMTMDSLRLLICHEVGHFLGGGPRRIAIDPNEDQTWNVVEGGADYFASLQCLKRVLMGQDHSATPVHPRCAAAFKGADEQGICSRSLAAAETLVKFFAEVKKVPFTFSIDTPDPTQTPSTWAHHPELQCRLDTYVAGALCDADPNVTLSPTDLAHGTCDDRPRCWFNPADFAAAP